jgi:F-type H+-transporting ATPase subunit delta
MQNPRLAERYAKSLMDIAQEQNVVASIYEDMCSLQAMFASSKDLTSLVNSPIIKADKKQAIFSALLHGKVNPITEKFIVLITNKTREQFLPEITNSFIQQYKNLNQINTVKLTTATALDENTKQTILAKISEQLQGKKIDLQTSVDESIIGGFLLESNNTLFDASIARDLKDIHKQFMQNIYIPSLK